MRLSRAGRHSRSARHLELAHRTMRPPARPVPPPAPRIIQNTIHQTVVHLHQTTHQRVFNRFTAAGYGTAALIVRQAPAPPAPEDGIDPSRPTLIAHKLLRILSADSAQRVLQPFFYRIYQGFREQEREIWRSRPSPVPPAAVSGLSGAEFQALVRGVADALGRQSRLESLRRGGT